MTPTFNSKVEELFIAYMDSEQPTIPYYFTNSDVPEDVDMYVVLHILSSEDVVQSHLGRGAKSRNVGVVQADVYAPKGEGGGPSNTLAHQIGKFFKRRDANAGVEGLITFKDPAVQTRGLVRGRYKEQMRIPYRYDFSDYP